MSEKYVESLIIRDDNRPEVTESTFADTDVDVEFEFEGKIKLVQIIKSVQNAQHNRHDYVFKIISIDKIKREI